MTAKAAALHGAKLCARCALLGLLVVFTMGGCLKIPTGSDAQESSNIISALIARCHFRVMRSDGRRPAVYRKPHPDYTKIFVYGEYTLEERTRIVAHARAVRSEKATKPIRLYFYPRELDQTGLLQEEQIP
jgi:hypothetical protein